MTQNETNFWDSDAHTWSDKDTHPILGKDHDASGEKRKAAIQEALAQLGVLQGERLINIGGGSGGAQLYLGPQLQVKEIIESDLSPKMLEANPTKLKVQLNAAETLPFSTNSADFISSFFLMRYLTTAQQQAFLTDCVRVLKPGGKAIILDHETISVPYEKDPFQPQKLRATFSSSQATISNQEIMGEYLNFMKILEDDDNDGYIGPVSLMIITKKT